MPLKKHHKIMIGSFSSFLIILLITNSMFIYILYGQLQLSYNELENKIIGLQTDTQTKFNEISESLMETKEDISSLNSQLGSIDEEISMLKASTSDDFSGIIEEVVKAIVTIKTDISQGTGFLINEDGYLVTNYHVIEGASAAGVYTYESELYSVKLIGANEGMDLALLKIDGDFEYLEFGDSDDIEVGEKVIAIGNPLGLQFSVSEGIISGIHRQGPSGINAYIQTDAALNPGNSGGPLIDKSAKVIGINNFKIGDSESLGFALESNYIVETINEISMEKLNQNLI